MDIAATGNTSSDRRCSMDIAATGNTSSDLRARSIGVVHFKVRSFKNLMGFTSFLKVASMMNLVVVIVFLKSMVMPMLCSGKSERSRLLFKLKIWTALFFSEWILVSKTILCSFPSRNLNVFSDLMANFTDLRSMKPLVVKVINGEVEAMS